MMRGGEGNAAVLDRTTELPDEEYCNRAAALALCGLGSLPPFAGYRDVNKCLVVVGLRAG